MYSQTASMLYFSCADMGTTGAASAMVPWMNACTPLDPSLIAERLPAQHTPQCAQQFTS